MTCIQQMIEAEGDAQLIMICGDLRYGGQAREQVSAAMSSGKSSSSQLSSGPQEVAPVTQEQKRHLVERMATCDGPLACHVLQRCLQRYVSTTWKQNSDGKRPIELEGWLISVLGVIVDCLEKVRDNNSETLTTARRLRCATFLLHMCSTILKTHRGASHPERAGQPPILLDTSTGDTPIEVDHRLNRAAIIATDNSEGIAEEYLVADVCAELSAECLRGMVQTTSEIMSVHQANVADVVSAGAYAGGDVMFWVLALLSDVLKHYGEKEWGLKGDLLPLSRERTGECVNENISAAPVSRTSETFAAKNQKLDAATKNHVPAIGPCCDILDLLSLASVVTSIPMEDGSGMVDVVLKWLEVTQLLLDAAEATTSSSTLEIIFTTVPAKLWRLTGCRRTLLPSDQPSTSPGAAFVDQHGASGALSQAMLRLTLSMIRVQSDGGLLAFQNEFEVGRCAQGRDEGRKSDDEGRIGLLRQERTAVPWSSAVEALSASCFVSCSDGKETGAGFGALLTRAFCDQDDALVDMLLTNLYIYRNARDQDAAVEAGLSELKSSRKCSGALRDLYRRYLHPASLFASLLSEVAFDCEVLLDWLISPETCFLQYLTLFLRLAVAEWSDFATRMSGISHLQVEGGGDFDAMATGDEQDERELVLSEEEAELLAKAISCLSGLADSARGLEKRQLLPYNLTPLLNRIDQIVELYEQCGDANECDVGDY